jgi:hypothetical protein
MDATSNRSGDWAPDSDSVEPCVGAGGWACVGDEGADGDWAVREDGAIASGSESVRDRAVRNKLVGVRKNLVGELVIINATQSCEQWFRNGSGQSRREGLFGLAATMPSRRFVGLNPAGR